MPTEAVSLRREAAGPLPRQAAERARAAVPARPSPRPRRRAAGRLRPRPVGAAPDAGRHAHPVGVAGQPRRGRPHRRPRHRAPPRRAGDPPRGPSPRAGPRRGLAPQLTELERRTALAGVRRRGRRAPARDRGRRRLDPQRASSRGARWPTAPPMPSSPPGSTTSSAVSSPSTSSDPGVSTAASEAGQSPEWAARGLAQVRSTSLALDGVPAVQVGQPQWYLTRPGFAWGGVGVAAIWYGASVALARTLRAAATRREPDQVALLHLGAVDTALARARAVLVDGRRRRRRRRHRAPARRCSSPSARGRSSPTRPRRSSSGSATRSARRR